MANPKTFVNYDRSHNDYARENRSKQTYAEKIMRNMIRKDATGYRFLRQKPIGPYIADFYCSALRLCIEIDGHSHDETADYDRHREIDMENLHITTVRYTNDEVILHPDVVRDDLSATIVLLAGKGTA